MDKQKKKAVLVTLKPLFENSPHLYVVKGNGLNAQEAHNLRKYLYTHNVQCKVIPNALLAILVAQKAYQGLNQVLQENSMVFFVKENPVAIAKIIKKFQKKTSKLPLKAAWIYQQLFVGANQLDTLTKLKSKEELIGDVVHLLQSPIKQLISALQSSKDKLYGVMKTLEEK